MGEERKDIFILGGPNGAGKTTAARVLLPLQLRMGAFLNADEIARRISPDNPATADLRAGRILLECLQEMIRQKRSFAFETTCAGRAYLKILRDCRASGWRVSLLYLWIPSAEYSLARVSRRVSQGGHSIPPEVIQRRYRTSLWNMIHLYLPLVDDAVIYDNRDGAMSVVARRAVSGVIEIVDAEIWAKILEETEWKQ